MPKFSSLLATIGLCLVAYTGLTGCGTKGPLYIPEQRYPQEGGTDTSPQPANPTTTTPVKDY